ncbi:hypothetical protein O9929_06205 [Vibrio lentus]|nr:hypothetical protein [Vibrio lentus]
MTGPRHLVEALIATGSRFYEHPGIDPIGITAIVVAISGICKTRCGTVLSTACWRPLLAAGKGHA